MGAATEQRDGSSSRRFGERVRGLFVSLATVLLTLVAAELVVSRCTSLGEDPLKMSFHTSRGFGHCYRSDDPVFPIDLGNPDARRALGRVLLGDDEELVRQGAMRCVTYDVRARRLGPHPERDRQIAIVGDSFAFGEGLAERDTLAYRLSERLPKMNFPSFAMSGFGVFQVRDAVDRVLGDPRHPSDIVYFYNINDVHMTSEMNDRFSYLMDFQNFRWTDAPEADVSSSILGRSSLYRMARRAAFMWKMTGSTTQSYLDMYFDPVNARGLADSEQALQAMVQKAREAGVGFWLVLYPLLHKDRSGRYPFQPIHDHLMAACRRWGAECVDGADAFSNVSRMKDLVVDRSDFHPNAAANERMVAYLAELPGFLKRPSTVTAATPGTVTLPVVGLDHASANLTVEGLYGRLGEYPVGGPMLSLDVEGPAEPALSLVVHGRAAPCRDPGGNEWPAVGIYVDDELVDTLRVDRAESTIFRSKPLSLSGRHILRLVHVDDYDDDRCDRAVMIDALDVLSAVDAPPAPLPVTAEIPPTRESLVGGTLWSASISVAGGAYVVVTTARGTRCATAPDGEPPIIALDVDEREVHRYAVESDTPVELTSPELSLDPGVHALALRFVNDYYDGPDCDRNAWATHVKLDAATPVTPPSAQ